MITQTDAFSYARALVMASFEADEFDMTMALAQLHDDPDMSGKVMVLLAAMVANATANYARIRGRPAKDVLLEALDEIEHLFEEGEDP